MTTNIQSILGEGTYECISSDGSDTLSATAAWAIGGLSQNHDVQTELDMSKLSNQFSCASHNIDVTNNGVALNQNAPALEGPNVAERAVSFDNTPGLG